MKCNIPEISWHNRDPVLSVDIQSHCVDNDGPLRLASGGMDYHVVIWHITLKDTGAVKIDVVADLQRHQKPVNVVRFSPSGEFLASGDDESVIIIWKQKTEQDVPEFPIGESEVNKEQWLSIRFLRGHMEDVCDLCWSNDSCSLISGSVDNTAILWDVHKGRNMGILKDHNGFVQGVAWDPKNQFVATLSSDRICRVYNVNTKRIHSRVSKAKLPVPDGSALDGKVVRLFHDDTLKSFFRRLSFSPDGEMLVTPSGMIEIPDSDEHCNATYIFTRGDFNRPAAYLPSAKLYTVAVRFCPLLFKLNRGSSMFSLPYRMIVAVATQCSVVLYDTQQPEPFAVISNIHYTRLTDISWSSDGRMLVISSTDGYCSIVTFSPGELGQVYTDKNQIVSGDLDRGINGMVEEEPMEVEGGMQVCESLSKPDALVSADQQGSNNNGTGAASELVSAVVHLPVANVEVTDVRLSWNGNMQRDELANGQRDMTIEKKYVTNYTVSGGSTQSAEMNRSIDSQEDTNKNGQTIQEAKNSREETEMKTNSTNQEYTDSLKTDEPVGAQEDKNVASGQTVLKMENSKEERKVQTHFVNEEDNEHLETYVEENNVEVGMLLEIKNCKDNCGTVETHSISVKCAHRETDEVADGQQETHEDKHKNIVVDIENSTENEKQVDSIVPPVHSTIEHAHFGIDSCATSSTPPKFVSMKTTNVTANNATGVDEVNAGSKIKVPRRVPFVTISSPKSKKKL